MKVYTFKELGTNPIVISIDSLEEAEQLTTLSKERVPSEITITEWLSHRAHRKEAIEKLINKDSFIVVHESGRWAFKEKVLRNSNSTIITVNQIKEYIDKYLPNSTSTKVVDIERLKNTKSFTLVQCKTRSELQDLFKGLKIQQPGVNWEMYCSETVIRIKNSMSWGFWNKRFYNKKYPNHPILSFDDICIKEESKTKNQTKNLNQQKEVKQMKKYLRVFSKGQLNVEGLFYQIEKEGLIEEPRAFVRELISKEVERVSEEADKLDFKKLKAKFVKRFNIQAVGALETMQKIREKSIFTSASEDVLLVLSYYEFQKQKDNKVVYDWIKPYLTQKVLSSPEETILFKSNNRKVFIKAGAIKLQEAKRAMISSVDIKYDRETNTFSL